MVKIINIDTKTRTIRVENADSDIKTWRTTESGAHFPIKKGESTKEALNKFIGSKRPEAKKKSSGLISGNPTFEELEAWSKKQQAKKAKQQPAKKEEGSIARKELSWQRGPRESEDAYFERRDKTVAEAKGIDKVSDWYDKVYHGDDVGLPKNKDITFDELAEGILSGKIKDFYKAVGTDESDAREKIFEELSERTGRPYDDFYDAWLYGGEKGTQSRVQKQKESVEYMNKLLKVGELDPELKRLIINARDRAKKEIK